MFPTLATRRAATLLSLSTLSTFCLPALAAEPPDANAAQNGLAQRIARVEQGLLPTVSVTGMPPARRALAEEMARLGIPGASIAVVHGGEIEWAKGYGVVTPGGAAVTTSTPFQAASISKPVAAMAALKLAESGVIALDRDVNTYFSRWKLPKDADDNAVTLRQLLSHTAGTTVHGFPGYAAGMPVPTIVQILNGAAPSNTRGVHVSSRPGSQWRYSGGGYTVVQYLLTERSGRAFPQLLADTVLKPLGMHDSSFEQPASPALLARVALPHDGAGKPIAGGPHTYPELAAAGLWTTPSDLARYTIEVRRSAAGQSNKVLSQSMTNMMLTPVRNEFGLGLGVQGEGQSQTFSHGGSNAGYQNMMVAYTERGEGIVVMTNGDRGSELANALVRSVAAEYNWPTHRTRERAAVAVSAASLQALPGTYDTGGMGDFTVARSADGLTIALPNAAPEPLHAAAGLGDTYFIASRGLELQFTPNGKGRLTTPGNTVVPFTRRK